MKPIGNGKNSLVISILKSFVLIGFIISQVACSNDKHFHVGSKASSGIPNDSFDDTDDKDPKISCFDQSERQPDATTEKKVDILIVADTSGSLDAERASVADGIDRFIAALGNDVDFQIGVMFAHGDRSQHSAKLYVSGSDPAVLSSKSLSRTQIRNHLQAKLTNVVNDADTDGGEAGLYSLNTSLSGTPFQTIRNQGFYRPDAGLAVVFISDENDICGEFPNGVTPVRDPSGSEEAARQRLCGNVTDTFVYQNLLNLKGSLPLILGSIIYKDENQVPAQGENEVGYGYREITQLNKGLLVDILRDDIPTGLGDIGQLTLSRLELRTQFKLNDSDSIDPSSLKVFVDGQEVTFQYSAITGEVTLLESDAGGAGSDIEISYCNSQ